MAPAIPLGGTPGEAVTALGRGVVLARCFMLFYCFGITLFLTCSFRPSSSLFAVLSEQRPDKARGFYTRADTDFASAVARARRIANSPSLGFLSPATVTRFWAVPIRSSDLPVKWRARDLLTDFTAIHST